MQDAKFVSFSQLQAQKKIPAYEFYRYLQICHFYQTHYAIVPSDWHTSFESLCQTALRQKGLISGLYKSMEMVKDCPK